MYLLDEMKNKSKQKNTAIVGKLQWLHDTLYKDETLQWRYTYQRLFTVPAFLWTKTDPNMIEKYQAVS